MKQPLKSENLFQSIKKLILAAQDRVIRSVNSTMVLTYFQIGRYIFQDELKGKGRADYAEKTMRQLSIDLTNEFGRGYSKSNLEYMRQFYRVYQSHQKENIQSKTGQSNNAVTIVQSSIGQSSAFNLSWTHYVQLIKIQNDDERNFYEIEAEKGNWSVKELQRQYNSSLYERLAISKNKNSVRKLAKRGQIIEKPTDTLKNHFVLEFLDLKESAAYTESDLENAIIDKLEHFMMELGKGFLFEAKQKRFTFEGDSFFIDLVFYNRLLRCYTLLDLKIGKLTHQDIGQMQMYVNYYDRKIKLQDENSTVGIILCKEENKTVIEFTLPENNKTIFAKEYKLYLPSKQDLKRQLE